MGGRDDRLSSSDPFSLFSLVVYTCSYGSLIHSLPHPHTLSHTLNSTALPVGFFSITNHGIPQAAIDGVFDSAKSFFALPQATKEDQCPFARQLNSGYEYMTQVTNSVRILICPRPLKFSTGPYMSKTTQYSCIVQMPQFPCLFSRDCAPPAPMHHCTTERKSSLAPPTLLHPLLHPSSISCRCVLPPALRIVKRVCKSRHGRDAWTTGGHLPAGPLQGQRQRQTKGCKNLSPVPALSQHMPTPRPHGS